MDAAPDIATDTATVVAVADANLRGQICEALQRMAVPVVQVDPVFEGAAGGPGSLIKYNPLSNLTSAECWTRWNVCGRRF